MNLTNLDLDTLRTLVAANDLGGFAQAADRLGRTPSAISLQMKRLQDELGMPLFKKEGRRLSLTEAGLTALGYARRILALNDELLDTIQGASLDGILRVGCPQDFAPVLPDVISQFAELYPRMQLELRIEGNAALADAVEKSQLDLALVIGHENRASAKTIGKIQLVWIASETFKPPVNSPLPIAVLGPQCTFRRCAIEQLESAGIEFRIAATSPSLNGIWAAVLGGLGITARTVLGLPEGLVHGESLFGIPALGFLPITLQSTSSTNAVVDGMGRLLADALMLRLQSSADKRRLHLATTRKRALRVR